MPEIDMRTVKNSLGLTHYDNVSPTGMKIVTCNFPVKQVIFMNKIVEEGGDSPSRSELIRKAVHEYLTKHYPGWLEEVRKIVVDKYGKDPEGDGDK